MNRPLNILHMTTFYPPYSFGGDAMYIYRLAHALGDEGHNVDVIHCVDSYHLQHPSSPEIKFQEHPNVHRHELRSRWKWLSPLLTHQTGRAYLKGEVINRILKSKPYDIIHYHNISLLGPEILTLRPLNDQFAKLYTTHEHWLVCPTHVLWKFNRRACERPECLRCTLMAKRPPQLWRYLGMLEETGKHVDRFVSPSRFTAGMHAARKFSHPVGHLPYFIEPADQDWQQPGPRPQEGPYFLFVGRLENIKGLQTIIPLWRDIPYDLLVAGTGTYEAQLKTLAAGNPRIKFLGPRPQRELGSLYHHALATLVPSITYETFGIIIVESFARKTPVIVRDLGALPEVVQDSSGGSIYRTDEELLMAIQQVAQNPALRSRMGENGYQAFMRSWSKEAHLKMYYGLVEEIMAQKYGGIPWKQEMSYDQKFIGSQVLTG
jgi:glycosyltransferase involved in cell wall biosynthesis